MLWLLLLALSAPVDAQAPARPVEGPSIDIAEEADLHFRLGVGHYRAGRFDNALEHLLMSNRLVPNRNVAFNIARAYEKLGRFEEAFRHYAEYVAFEPDAERRAVGEQAIRNIEDKLALVHLTSTPPGATVYVDRKDLGPRGRTPVSLALPPGEHRVFFELDGHAADEADVTVATGERQALERALEPILGTLRVDGSPPGATVHLGDEDGPVLGTLPATVELPPGSHVLVARADGYRTVRQVASVEADQTTRTALTLPLITGTVVVNAPERDALVEIDGRAAGFTPAVLEIPSGEHTVRVSLRGYKPYVREIVVDPDDSVTLDVQLRSLREVTAASRTSQAVEDAPASVTLISAEEIRAFGHQDLYQALGGVRGIFQSNDLTYKYLGVRGFSRPGDYGNRLLVTIDGHTMNDDQLGASYVGSDFITDLADVERIEVVRGPGSALYGSNAFFGVVNVVTRDGTHPTGTHATVTADEERTVRSRVGTSFGGEQVGGWLSAAGMVSQGRDYVFEEFATLPRGNGGLAQGADDFQAGTLHTRLWAGDLTFQAFHHTRSKRFPTGAFGTRLADARNTSDDHRSLGELRYDPKLGDRTELHARAWLDAYQYLGRFPYTVDYLYQDTWKGAWAGVEPRLVTRPTDWLSLTAGAELRNHFTAHLQSQELEDLQGNEPLDVPLDERPTFGVWSGYAIAEVGGAPVRLSLGGRLDHYRTPEAVDDDFTTFNPRAAVILKPDEDNVLKLMGGTAFRAPSVYEYLYNDAGLSQLPALSLEPETILTVEVEYVRRLGEDTTLTLAGYHNNIAQLVTTEAVTDEVFRYANRGDPTRTVGVEYELRRDWRRGWMAVFQHSVQRTRVGDLVDGALLTNAPPHLLSLKAAAPLVPGVSTISTMIRAESPRATDRGDETPWALIWDATVTGDLPGSAISYGVGVRNLLDWRYTHAAGPELLQDQLLQPGRGLFATLTARR